MMKKLFASIALAALVCSPALAAIGTIDQVPAATMLLPYFAVDLGNANPHTTISIGNSSSSEVLAHAVLWTDRGVPTLSFDVRLNAYGTQEIDLNALFTAGTLPQTTAGNFGSCTASLPPAAIGSSALTQLQNAHRGLASDLFGGNCGGAPIGDNVARGYLTIDVTKECSSTIKLPTDSGYFVAGGAGVATNDNVLFGEYSVYDTVAAYAHGDALVAIEASASDPLTDGPPNLDINMNPVPDYTFYRRQTGSADDNRESLPQLWMGRYVKDGVFSNTNHIVWRDPGAATSFPCASAPAGLSIAGLTSFNENEDPTANCPPTALASMPYAAQSVNLSDPTRLSVPYDAGFIAYDLNLTSASGDLGTRNQGFVSQILINSNDRAQAAAWPLQFISNVSGACSECNDGLDNDGDGDIDYPNDDGCPGATGVEKPQCSNGIDDDGDTKIDYPDDPECWRAQDNNEFANPQCDDGIDNDLDGLTDYQQDPRCFGNPNGSTEAEGICGNGIDDDTDGDVDFPADSDCSSRSDSTENPPACSDGIDNDNDTKTDFPDDPGCASATSGSESPACNDGQDNDSDNQTDYPADPGCASADSNSESPACSDGADNDFDNKTDYPDDPTCTSASGSTESSICSDGFDNDLDGKTDYPDDTGCASIGSDTESPACADGQDNDGDGATDYPADTTCSSLSGTSEGLPGCGDGVDNNGNGLIDFPDDPSCSSAADLTERAACSDGVDNDSDGIVDYPADTGCASANDNNELGGSTQTQCSDGIDNDGDGRKDYPSDTGCSTAGDDLEYAAGDAVAPPPLPNPAPVASTAGLAAVVITLLLVAAARLGRIHQS